MKRIFGVIIFVLIAVMSVNAQTSKRATALNQLKYNELDEAKETIEEVIKHPKTIKDARSWWYRGQIYQAIYISKEFKHLSPDAITIAFDSYKQALLYNFKDPALQVLDIENSKLDQIKFQKALMDMNTKYEATEIIIDIVQKRYPYLANIMVNKGVDDFQNKKDYKSAQEAFERSLFVSSMTGRVDTAVIYYTALSAQKAKDYKTSNEYFKKTIEVGYGTSDQMKAEMYILWGSNYKELGDTAKYLKTIDKGIEKFPNESVLLVEKINYYISEGKSEEAKVMLITATEKEPNNKLLFFNLGVIYEKSGDLDNAEKAYKRCVEIDPGYATGNYSLGALYFNKGGEMYNQADEIPPTKPKEYDAKLAEAKAMFEKALPLLEKALEKDPEDLSTMTALKTIYYKLEMNDKFKEMNDKVKAKTN